MARIRVRGGRRSRSSSAGSSITQRPRSLISGRFASASAAISSASSSAPSSVSCQRKSSSAASPNPASVSCSGAGVTAGPQFEAVVEHAGRPHHLDAGARQLLGRRAEQAGQRVVVQVDRRRAGLLAAPRASGGQTAAPRRSASSRSVSACGPNLASTVSGWFHSEAASTIRLGSPLLRNCRTSRTPERARSRRCLIGLDHTPVPFQAGEVFVFASPLGDRSSPSPGAGGTGTASIRRPAGRRPPGRRWCPRASPRGR